MARQLQCLVISACVLTALAATASAARADLPLFENVSLDAANAADPAGAPFNALSSNYLAGVGIATPGVVDVLVGTFPDVLGGPIFSPRVVQSTPEPSAWATVFAATVSGGGLWRRRLRRTSTRLA